jgi:hypothetical protein
MILFDMAKKFGFVLKGDRASKLEEIKVAAARSGIAFQGDLSAGCFQGEYLLFGQISGTYVIAGDIITVTVDEKPSVMSWEGVRSRLRGFIEG